MKCDAIPRFAKDAVGRKIEHAEQTGLTITSLHVAKDVAIAIYASPTSTVRRTILWIINELSVSVAITFRSSQVH